MDAYRLGRNGNRLSLIFRSKFPDKGDEMNQEELISVAAEAIDKRPFLPKKHYHLCHSNGHLCCLPKKHTDDPHPIFALLTYGDINLGLTPAKWNDVGKKLKKFYKEATPCIQPTVRSKP